MNTLINGQSSDIIRASDRGLSYGDGLFETIEVSQGRLIYWEDHLKRLTAGCERLSIPAPDHTQLLGEANQLIGPGSEGVIKIIITRGEGGRGYKPPEPAHPTRILTVHPKPDYPDLYKKRGVKLKTCTTRLAQNSLFAGLKHLNRLEQVMARAELNDAVWQEGLMLDFDGHPVEGIMSNIFWISAGELCTPDLSLCGVSGIVRAIIIELAKKNNIPCRIDRFTMDQLLSADELFMTNSLIGIWPVQSLDSHKYPNRVITQKIMGLLNNQRGIYLRRYR